MISKKITDHGIFWLLFLSLPLYVLVSTFYPQASEARTKIFQLLLFIYLTGAFVYHLRQKSLTLEIVLEYFLIAALSFILLSSLAF